MADEKVKLPKWVIAIFVTLGLGLVGTITSLIVYVHERDIDALNANTGAVNKLTATMQQNTWLDSLQQVDIGRIQADIEEIKKAVKK